MKNEDLPYYLNSLIVWAEGRGYFIHFEKNGDNCICSTSKIIEINSSAPLRYQVYCLLHECGHVAIAENGSFWDYEKRPRYLYSKPPSEHEDPKVKEIYRVYTVIEEAEAWKRGLNLAHRLGIPIDKEEWEAEMLDALGKYIDWAAS
jgi:hypothetical protein